MNCFWFFQIDNNLKDELVKELDLNRNFEFLFKPSYEFADRINLGDHLLINKNFLPDLETYSYLVQVINYLMLIERYEFECVSKRWELNNITYLFKHVK